MNVPPNDLPIRPVPAKGPARYEVELNSHRSTEPSSLKAKIEPADTGIEADSRQLSCRHDAPPMSLWTNTIRPIGTSGILSELYCQYNPIAN